MFNAHLPMGGMSHKFSSLFLDDFTVSEIKLCILLDELFIIDELPN